MSLEVHSTYSWQGLWAYSHYVALLRFGWGRSVEWVGLTRTVTRIHPGFTQTAGEPHNRGRFNHLLGPCGGHFAVLRGGGTMQCEGQG